jgi:hypothetical protein
MRKLAALAALTVVSLGFAADAYACSCLPVDLERDLPKADAAMIGSVLERRTTETTRVYLFRVEQVYRGELDSSRVEVETPRDGAACGLELAVGQRVGLLLERQGQRLRSTLCSQVDPSDFLALTNVEDNTFPPINRGGIIVGIVVLGLAAILLVRKARSYRRLR